MATVCAVVVTYNRKDLLQDCLEAISKQTHPCARLVVIDNASTDGTFEMLQERWAGRVEVHSLPQNVGAAGGFNAGMRLGYRTGADHIWVMDDDVIPAPDALERLLNAHELLDSRGVSAPFLISTARAPNGILTNVPEVDRRLNPLAYQNWPEFLEYGLVPVTRATFVSILLPRQTLNRYGLPIAGMFIWGEDTEYTLRITAEGPGYMVGGSRAIHVRQLSGALDIRTEVHPVRISYHKHLVRNRIYNLRRYGGRLSLTRHLLEFVSLGLRLLLKGEHRKAQVVIAGVLLGISFNPTVEAADAPFQMAGVRSSAAAERDTEGEPPLQPLPA